ncbi:MAG TPA: uroporphyrinogen decarboxylase [Bacteroides sp.]|nr:uroporphyrinogen decarboxylase [Bacteroides sp.]
MTEAQWNKLRDVIDGKAFNPIPTGFIVDSPWLPNWYGVNILDYFTNDEIWLNANLHVADTFPGVMFLPGFWSEFGMCTEPSAFGSKCALPKNEFPNTHRVIHSMEEIPKMKKPDPKTDGFAPFMLNRLLLNRQKIEDSGHRICFSVSRGPLNIASFLMGMTEFMTAMITNPEEVHQLLDLINEYLLEWHELQAASIPTIDGIFVLDDIIGFIGEEEFREFGLPYFKKLFSREASVKFLHNDATCKSSIKYMNEMGVNLFNMGFESDLNELKTLTMDRVTMMGNIPPRDVLANGTGEEIEKAVKALIGGLKQKSRVIMSCGGGMPPDVTSEQIRAFTDAVAKYS